MCLPLGLVVVSYRRCVENLAAGTGDYPIAKAVKAWTDESGASHCAHNLTLHGTHVISLCSQL